MISSLIVIWYMYTYIKTSCSGLEYMVLFSASLENVASRNALITTDFHKLEHIEPELLKKESGWERWWYISEKGMRREEEMRVLQYKVSSEPPYLHSTFARIYVVCIKDEKTTISCSLKPSCKVLAMWFDVSLEGAFLIILSAK